jgi:hypothetical protein
MNQGLWVWPEDQRGQQQALAKISQAPHLVTALTAISKSKDGLSNAELDDTLTDNSVWRGLWIVRQLLSLGFVEYRVDFFGNPARYVVTDKGRDALQKLTGQPVPAQPAAAAAPQPRPPSPAAPPMQATTPTKPPETRPNTQT